jgi:hypothetical protein
MGSRNDRWSAGLLVVHLRLVHWHMVCAHWTPGPTDFRDHDQEHVHRSTSGALGSGCSLVVDAQEEGKIRASLPDAEQHPRPRHGDRAWSRNSVGSCLRLDGRSVMARDVQLGLCQVGVPPRVSKCRILRGIPVPRLPLLATGLGGGGRASALDHHIHRLWAGTLLLGTVGNGVDHDSRLHLRSCRALARQRVACRRSTHALGPLHRTRPY